MKDARINGKKKHIIQKYIGPEDRLQELEISNLLTKHTSEVDCHTISFGISAALWQIAREINLVDSIDDKLNKTRQQGLSPGEYFVIAAINRCAAPCSKSKLGNWFQKDWLSTQFETNSETLNAQTYWNHFQYLDKEAIESIEVVINRVMLQKYELKMDSLFYDPTNYYSFSKTQDPDSLLQFGHSKENRNGNKLISYSLLCARESGVPIMHETYPGNLQDAEKFKDVPVSIMKRLNSLGIVPKDVTLIFDKGNHSKDAFDAIEQAGFGFIVSARNSTQKDLLHIAPDKLVEITLPMTKKQVKYFKTSRKIYGIERDVYVVLDPKKQMKHTMHFEAKLEEKIVEIKDFFKERINIKKWRDSGAVEKKLKEMIGRNPFKRIITYDIQGEYAQLSFKLTINKTTKDNHIRTLGRTVLFTNRTQWEPESIIWGYREQYIVEHAFREMKSPTAIAVRPMFHHADRSIRGHVFICVLGLLLLSLLRLTLARDSIVLSYDEILEELRAIHLLKILTCNQATPIWKLETTGILGTKIAKKLNFKQFVPK